MFIPFHVWKLKEFKEQKGSILNNFFGELSKIMTQLYDTEIEGGIVPLAQALSKADPVKPFLMKHCKPNKSYSCYKNFLQSTGMRFCI